MLCKLWQKSDSSINLLCPSSIRGSYFPLCQKQNKCCSALWFLINSMSPMISNGLQTLPQINSSGSLWIAIVMMRNWSFLLWECFMWQRDWSHIQISQAAHDFSKHRIYYWISCGENETIYDCISASMHYWSNRNSVLHSRSSIWRIISVQSNLGKFKPARVLQAYNKLPPTIKTKKPKWCISRISTGAALKVSHFLWLDALRLISEKVPACSLWLNSMGLQQS